jgi:Glucose / Sorbosone dehydrogenase
MLLLVLTIAGCSSGGDRVTFSTVSNPAGSNPKVSPATASSGQSSERASNRSARETIATGLPVPWGLAFLPDGTALVTLRDHGKVLHILNGSRQVSVGRVPGVGPAGEGGLLGIAVSPTFASDRSVFAYFTSRNDNRVIRMTFDGTSLRPGPIIVSGIPKARNHNGGRLAFGPDGYLYISTMAALRGESLWRIPLDSMGNAGEPQRLLQGQYGRGAPSCQRWTDGSGWSPATPSAAPHAPETTGSSLFASPFIDSTCPGWVSRTAEAIPGHTSDALGPRPGDSGFTGAGTPYGSDEFSSCWAGTEMYKVVLVLSIVLWAFVIAFMISSPSDVRRTLQLIRGTGGKTTRPVLARRTG